MRGIALVVPGVNVTLLARAIIVGGARALPALIVIVSTLVYGGLAMSVAARLYDSERLLYADDQRLSLADWLRRLLFGAAASVETSPASSAAGRRPPHRPRQRWCAARAEP